MRFLHLLVFLGLSRVALSQHRYGVATVYGALTELENEMVQEKCGRAPQPLRARGSHFFVLNGQNVTQNQMLLESPWVVSINYESEDPSNIFNMSCTGTLISPRHVLTAAHCLVFNDNGRTKCNEQTLQHKADWSHKDPSRFRLRVGTICGHWHCKEGKIYDVNRIFYPHSYTNGEGRFSHCTPYNQDTEDIAIFELTSDVHGARFPCLAQATRKDVPLTNYGYGKALESSQEQFVLKKHTLKYVDCNKYWHYPDDADKGVDCARYNQRNTSLACVGDSGGPVVAKYGDRTYSVGVLAGGTDCLEGKESGPSQIKGDQLTSIPYYLNWICKWTGVCPGIADPTKDRRPTAILK